MAILLKVIKYMAIFLCLLLLLFTSFTWYVCKHYTLQQHSFRPIAPLLFLQQKKYMYATHTKYIPTIILDSLAVEHRYTGNVGDEIEEGDFIGMEEGKPIYFQKLQFLLLTDSVCLIVTKNRRSYYVDYIPYKGVANTITIKDYQVNTISLLEETLVKASQLKHPRVTQDTSLSIQPWGVRIIPYQRIDNTILDSEWRESVSCSCMQTYIPPFPSRFFQ